jgi:hypothetical protein
MLIDLAGVLNYRDLTTSKFERKRGVNMLNPDSTWIPAVYCQQLPVKKK